MPRPKFTDIQGAWEPLQENERLDSYYHHCQVSGFYRLRREHLKAKSKPPPPRKHLYGISAESLCLLPDVIEEETVALPPEEEPVVLPDLPPVKVYATRYEPAVRGAPDLPVLQLRDAVTSDVTDGRRVITFKGKLRLALQSPTPWATVKYTTDGEPVSARSSQVYQDSSGLDIDRDTTLRVASCKRGWLSPELQVHFVREDSSEADVDPPAEPRVEPPPASDDDHPPDEQVNDDQGEAETTPAVPKSSSFVRSDVPRNDEPRKKRQTSTVTPIKV